MIKSNLYLIDINLIGKTYNEEHIYELIFNEDAISSKKIGIDCFSWGSDPAMRKPMNINNENLVLFSKFFITKIKLELLKNSGSYSLKEAFDDIMPIAWSKEKHMGERINLRYGEPLDSIDGNLFSYNIDLKNELKHIN